MKGCIVLDEPTRIFLSSLSEYRKRLGMTIKQVSECIGIPRWVFLSAIIIFLAGFFIWIFTGQLEISFPALIYSDPESSSAFLTIDQASRLKEGMTVRISDTDTTGTVKEVSRKSISYSDIASQIGEDVSEIMGVTESSRLFRVSMNFGSISHGISSAVFVIDTVKPVNFLLKNVQ